MSSMPDVLYGGTGAFYDGPVNGSLRQDHVRRNPCGGQAWKAMCPRQYSVSGARRLIFYGCFELAGHSRTFTLRPAGPMAKMLTISPNRCH